MSKKPIYLSKRADGLKVSPNKYVQSNEGYDSLEKIPDTSSSYKIAREMQVVKKNRANNEAAIQSATLFYDSDEFKQISHESLRGVYEQVNAEINEENKKNLTKLPASQEEVFQKAYKTYAEENGQSLNPDDAEHYYDYRAAFLENPNLAKTAKDMDGHLSSKFKLDGHPNRVIKNKDGKYYDTRDGSDFKEISLPLQDDITPDNVKQAIRDIATSGRDDEYKRKQLNRLLDRARKNHQKTSMEQLREKRKLYDEEEKRISRSGSSIWKKGQRAYYAFARGAVGIWNVGAVATDEEFALALREASQVELATRPETFFDKMTEAAAESAPIMGVTAASQFIPVVGPAVGMAAMGSVEGADTYIDMRAKGYSKEDATTAGIAVGLTSAWLEHYPTKFLGKSKVFKHAAQTKAGRTAGGAMINKADDVALGAKRFLSKDTKKIYNKALVGSSTSAAAKRIASDVALNTVGEGLEEALQEVAGQFIPASIVGEDYLPQTKDGEVDWGAMGSQVAWAGLTGGILGGAFSGKAVTKNIGYLRKQSQFREAMGNWARFDEGGHGNGLSHSEGQLAGMAAVYDMAKADPEGFMTPKQREQFIRSRLTHYTESIINDPVGRTLYNNSTAEVIDTKSHSKDFAQMKLRSGEIIDIRRVDANSEFTAAYEDAEAGKNAIIYVTADDIEGMDSHELVHHALAKADAETRVGIAKLFSDDIVGSETPQEAAAVQMQQREVLRSHDSKVQKVKNKVEDMVSRVEVLFKGDKASMASKKNVFFQKVDAQSKTRGSYAHGKETSIDSLGKSIADTIAAGTGRQTQVDDAGSFVIEGIDETTAMKLMDNVQPLTEGSDFEIHAATMEDGTWSIKIRQYQGGVDPFSAEKTYGQYAEDKSAIFMSKAVSKTEKTDTGSEGEPQRKPSRKQADQARKDRNAAIFARAEQAREASIGDDVNAKVATDGSWVIAGFKKGDSEYIKLADDLVEMTRDTDLRVEKRKSNIVGEWEIIVRSPNRKFMSKKSRSDGENVYHQYKPEPYINTEYQDRKKRDRVAAYDKKRANIPGFGEKLTQFTLEGVKIVDKGATQSLRKDGKDYDGIAFEVEKMPMVKWFAAREGVTGGKDKKSKYSIRALNIDKENGGIDRQFTREYDTAEQAVRAFKLKMDGKTARELHDIAMNLNADPQYQKPINLETFVPTEFTALKNRVLAQRDRAGNMQKSIRGAKDSNKPGGGIAKTIKNFKVAYDTLNKTDHDLQEKIDVVVYNSSRGYDNRKAIEALEASMEKANIEVDRMEKYADTVYEGVRGKLIDSHEVTDQINKEVAYLQRVVIGEELKYAAPEQYNARFRSKENTGVGVGGNKQSGPITSKQTEKLLHDASQVNADNDVRDIIDDFFPDETIANLRQSIANTDDKVTTRQKEVGNQFEAGEYQGDHDVSYYGATGFGTDVTGRSTIPALFPTTNAQADRILNKHLSQDSASRTRSFEAGQVEYQETIARIKEIQPQVKAGNASLLPELTYLREKLNVLKNVGRKLQTENRIMSKEAKPVYPGSVVNGEDIGNTGLKVSRDWNLIDQMTDRFGDLWLLVYASAPRSSRIYKTLNKALMHERVIRKANKETTPQHGNAMRSIYGTPGIDQRQNITAKAHSYFLSKKTGKRDLAPYQPVIGSTAGTGHNFSIESLIQFAVSDVGIPRTGDDTRRSHDMGPHQAGYEAQISDENVKQDTRSYIPASMGMNNISAEAFAMEVVYALRDVFAPGLTEQELTSEQWTHQTNHVFKTKKDGSPLLVESSVAARGLDYDKKLIANIMQYANKDGYVAQDIERTLGEILKEKSAKYRDMMQLAADEKSATKATDIDLADSGRHLRREANRHLRQAVESNIKGQLADSQIATIANDLRQLQDIETQQSPFSRDALEDGIGTLVSEVSDILTMSNKAEDITKASMEELKKLRTGIKFMEKADQRTDGDRYVSMNYSQLIDKWFGLRNVSHVKNQIKSLYLQETWDSMFGITPKRKMRHIIKDIANRATSLDTSRNHENSRKYSLATYFLIDAMDDNGNSDAGLRSTREGIQKQLERDDLSNYQKALLNKYLEAANLAEAISSGIDPKAADIMNFIGKEYIPETDANWEYLNRVVGSDAKKIKYYAPRIYTQSVDAEARAEYGRFGTSTGRAKSRKYDDLGQAIANGETLEHESFLDARLHGQDQVINVSTDQNMLATGLQANYLSTKKLGNYIKLDHPGAYIIEHDGTSGQKRKSAIYAPAEFANHFNRITSGSKVRQNEFINKIIGLNATLKMMKILFGMFHRRSFVWSAMMGGPLVVDGGDNRTIKGLAKNALGNINYNARRKEGWDSIMNMDRETERLLEHMTLFRIQDYDVAAGNRQGATSKFLMGGQKGTFKSKVGTAFQQFEDVRSQYQQELFGVFGASLKMGTAKRELSNQLNQNKETIGKEKQESMNKDGGTFEDAFSQTEDTIYREVGKLMDRDFGGLNTDRMGVSRTTQDVLRLLFLGPDWTASNILSMAGTFKSKNGKFGSSQTKIGAELHRRFWGRVAIRGAAATLLVNLVMAGFDDDDIADRVGKAWERGGLKWAMADISPAMHLTGGSKRHDYYLNMFGHFLDPLKFAKDPLKSFYYKSSAVVKPFMNAAQGHDFAGRRYSDVWEIPTKGLADWGRKRGPVKPTEVPAWLTKELMNAAPIQLKSLLHFFAGQSNALKTIAELGIGADVKQTYGKVSSLKDVTN